MAAPNLLFVSGHVVPWERKRFREGIVKRVMDWSPFCICSYNCCNQPTPKSEKKQIFHRESPVTGTRFSSSKFLEFKNHDGGSGNKKGNVKSITPDNHRQSFSEKDGKFRTENRKPDDNSAFQQTLQSSIERMNDISERADAALQSLPGTNQDEFESIIEQACSIHRRMMQVQYNLATLYQKMKVNKK